MVSVSGNIFIAGSHISFQQNEPKSSFVYVSARTCFRILQKSKYLRHQFRIINFVYESTSKTNEPLISPSFASHLRSTYWFERAVAHNQNRFHIHTRNRGIRRPRARIIISRFSPLHAAAPESEPVFNVLKKKGRLLIQNRWGIHTQVTPMSCVGRSKNPI